MEKNIDKWMGAVSCPRLVEIRCASGIQPNFSSHLEELKVGCVVIADFSSITLSASTVGQQGQVGIGWFIVKM